MAISTSRWHRWWHGFKEVGKTLDQPLEELAKLLGEPLELLVAWREIWDSHQKTDPGLTSRLGLDLDQDPWLEPGGATSRQAFGQRLRQRYGYSVAAVEQFLDELVM